MASKESKEKGKSVGSVHFYIHGCRGTKIVLCNFQMPLMSEWVGPSPSHKLDMKVPSDVCQQAITQSGYTCCAKKCEKPATQGLITTIFFGPGSTLLHIVICVAHCNDAACRDELKGQILEFVIDTLKAVNDSEDMVKFLAEEYPRGMPLSVYCSKGKGEFDPVDSFTFMIDTKGRTVDIFQFHGGGRPAVRIKQLVSSFMKPNDQATLETLVKEHPLDAKAMCSGPGCSKPSTCTVTACAPDSILLIGLCSHESKACQTGIVSQMPKFAAEAAALCEATEDKEMLTTLGATRPGTFSSASVCARSGCGKKYISKVICKACKKTAYCSGACRKKDRESHKENCAKNG